MKIYYGLTIDPDNNTRTIYATITGQMDTGQYIYTELAQDEHGAVLPDQMLLDNQYIRTLKHGTQLFIRI